MTGEELEQIYDCIDEGFADFGDRSDKLSTYIKALEKENERLKGKLESQDHIAHNREMVSPNKNNIYNPLKMFYEIAEKYFATSTPQDLENAIKEQRETNVIVHKGFIEHLRKENERLDGEVNRLEATNESLADEQVKILDERDELRNAVLGLTIEGTLNSAWELYKHSQHSLWMTRALRANDAKSVVSMYEYNAKHRKSKYNDLAYNAGKVWEDHWEWVERKCREKAKEFE